MTDDERIHQIAELIDGFSYKGMMALAEQLIDSHSNIEPGILDVDTAPADLSVWLSTWARLRLESDAEAEAEAPATGAP